MTYKISLKIVFLAILPLVYTQSAGDLRLKQRNVTDPSFTEGRLEIFFNGQWGTICEDHFDNVDANVACRQLGYNGSMADPVAGFHSRFGKGEEGPIWLDDVACADSNGLHILSCPSSGVGTHNCDHFSDIAVICNPVPISPNLLNVRLQGGTYRSQGRVEVYCNEEWGAVCNEGIEQHEADLICRQLGYTEASSYESMNHTSQVDSRVWFDSLSCSNEDTFESCVSCPSPDFQLQPDNTCASHTHDLFLQCSHSISYGTIRLSQGNISLSTDFSEGRLEIFINGAWRTICVDTFSKIDADAICEELGYLRAEDLTTSNQLGYGQGDGNIWTKVSGCTIEPDRMISCLAVDSEMACSQPDPVAIVCTNEPLTTQQPTHTTDENSGLMLPFSLEVLIGICIAGGALLCFCCLFMIVCCTHLCCDHHIASKKQRPLLDRRQDAFTFGDIDSKLDDEYNLEMKLNAHSPLFNSHTPPQLIPCETPQIPIDSQTPTLDQPGNSPYPFPQEIERIKLRLSQENLLKESPNHNLQSSTLASNLKDIADQLEPPVETSLQEMSVRSVSESIQLHELPSLESISEEERKYLDEDFEEESQAMRMSFEDIEHTQ